MTRRSLLPLLVLTACSDDVGLVDAPMIVDAPIPGVLQLSWTISHDGAPVTCTQIAGSSVTVEIVKVGEFGGVVDSFGCASAAGTSRALVPGMYDLELSLTGAGGTLDGPIDRNGFTVSSGEPTTVDAVAFDVDPSGTLSFRVATGVDNCAAMPAGAGITATRIELRDSAGACVPTTFEIAAGATSGTPASTYASDCAAATHGCIAADQDVTATGVASGQHTMAIVGLVGAQACWGRTGSFVVRAAGQTTMLNPQMLVRNTVLCPP